MIIKTDKISNIVFFAICLLGRLDIRKIQLIIKRPASKKLTAAFGFIATMLADMLVNNVILKDHPNNAITPSETIIQADICAIFIELNFTG